MSETKVNIVSKRPSLSFVAMPIVTLMADGGLSWAEREQCSHALLATIRHHRDLFTESQEQMTGAQMQVVGGVGTGRVG